MNSTQKLKTTLIVLIFWCQLVKSQSADQLIKVKNVANTNDVQNISSPYEGSLIYVQSKKDLFIRTDNDWRTFWGNQGNNADSSYFIGSTTPHDFKIRTNNSQRMIVRYSGKVGINLINPSGIFHVYTGGEHFLIHENSNVGIGVISPTKKLHVSGDILASGSITPDYVFENYFEGRSELNPNYEFKALEKVKEFVKKNKHLPGVPSAKEIKKQGGIIVNKATEINLEKIEELYLYLFELDEKNQTLERKISSIEKALLKSKP